MSAGMLLMWLSFIAIICMFLAVGMILLSRYKFNNIYVKWISKVIAYIFVMIAGIIIIIVMI